MCYCKLYAKTMLRESRVGEKDVLWRWMWTRAGDSTTHMPEAALR